MMQAIAMDTCPIEEEEEEEEGSNRKQLSMKYIRAIVPLHVLFSR
jgi:hypothetical protein